MVLYLAVARSGHYISVVVPPGVCRLVIVFQIENLEFQNFKCLFKKICKSLYSAQYNIEHIIGYENISFSRQSSKKEHKLIQHSEFSINHLHAFWLCNSVSHNITFLKRTINVQLSRTHNNEHITMSPHQSAP